MAQTAAQRKAQEVQRKAEIGLKRRSFWMSDESMNIIETYKLNHNLKTNDEAIAALIKQIEN